MGMVVDIGSLRIRDTRVVIPMAMRKVVAEAELVEIDQKECVFSLHSAWLSLILYKQVRDVGFDIVFKVRRRFRGFL